MLVFNQEAMLLHGGGVAGKVTKKKAVKKAAGAVRNSKAAPRKRRSSTVRVSEAIDHAIENIQVKLATDAVKPSVADLVRLLQLKKELDGERPKDVTVRWVDESDRIQSETECNDNAAKDE